MANFMQAFEDQRENYLAHYGKKGMKWGVITSEYEPVGTQPGQQQEVNGSTPEYSEEDQRSMQTSADTIRGADAESVKDKRKRIVKNIIKGVAIGAIVAGIAAGAVKGYAKKQTGEKQDLATSIGIVGQKFRSKPGQIGDAVKKGFNMDTGAVKAENKAEQIRKRNERAQAFKNAAGKVGNAVGNAAGKVGQAVGNAKRSFEEKAQARSQAAETLRKSVEESKNMNIRFPQGQGRFKSGTEKMDFGSIVSERAKSTNETNNMDIQNIRFPQGQGRFKSGTPKLGFDRVTDPNNDQVLLRNRTYYNARKKYYETPNSRIYK